jgi:hypothetical protein
VFVQNLPPQEISITDASEKPLPVEIRSAEVAAHERWDLPSPRTPELTVSSKPLAK